MMSAQPTAEARYALLHLGMTKLLLAQPDIREIESVGDIDTIDAPMGGIGRIHINRQTYPVYCLTEEFELTDAIPASRKMCVLLAHQGGQFGLLCDRVDMVGSPAGFHALPECMRLDDTPVEALVALPEGVACVSSAHRLAALMPLETSQEDVHQPERASA